MPAVLFTAEKGENDDFLWLKFSPAGTRKLDSIIVPPAKKANRRRIPKNRGMA
jgi:hypothetical protein